VSRSPALTLWPCRAHLLLLLLLVVVVVVLAVLVLLLLCLVLLILLLLLLLLLLLSLVPSLHLLQGAVVVGAGREVEVTDPAPGGG
jgi:hypothetical protein